MAWLGPGRACSVAGAPLPARSAVLRLALARASRAASVRSSSCSGNAASRGSSTPHLLNILGLRLEQVLEEGPVVHHRLAQILGCGFASGLALRDRVRRPIVLDLLRMVDRNIGGPLLEIAHGIAACLHHLLHQAIGLPDGPLGVIDEPGLHRAPAVSKAGPVRRGTRAN